MAADQTNPFPLMNKYLQPLKNPGKRNMVGREDIIKLVLATLNRTEISNVALVGEAGTGKTTVAYGVADLDQSRDYFEVRLSLMSSSEGGVDGSTEMATRLTQLIDEVSQYQAKYGVELVLFMDEFHLVMELSPSAIEALKPILANSGARGIKIIVATTFEEYDEYIRPNEALNERLERIVLPELSFDETLSALTGFMHVNVPDVYVDQQLLRQIIAITDQVFPAQKQPRKSLRVIDAMNGWYKTFGGDFDNQLLARLMKARFGVDIDYQVNVRSIESTLSNRVYDQSLAIRAVCDRLNISVAKLNDPGRPRGSFLFTGSTGVGKTELAKAMANVLFGRDDDMIRFDMTEYSKASSVELLQDRLSSAMHDHPSSVILMDEIEKAAPACSKLMLQVLDDAQMTDRNGREVSFKQSYVIFTTNAGALIYGQLQAMYGNAEHLSDADLHRQQRKMLESYTPLIRDALTKNGSGFPPELLGRFDKVVPFAPLGQITRYKICKSLLGKLKKQVQQIHGVELHFDHNVERYIVEEHAGSNEAENGGGREIRRKIEENVTARVAAVLNLNLKLQDLAVWVSGTMAIDNVLDNQGQAEIMVGKWNGES